MSDLRVAVLGVGIMGADHVARLAHRISGASVTVVNDYLTEKAETVAADSPGCRAIADPLDAIADPDVDAVVLATPGPTHEKQLLACIEHDKPVLCEKPLTTDVATSLEVVLSISLPYVRRSAIGAVMLGLGRALGETMAVTFVIGNSHDFPKSFFSSGSTLASTIANEFNEATGAMHSSALIALGVVLFIMTFAVLAIARFLLGTEQA